MRAHAIFCCVASLQRGAAGREKSIPAAVVPAYYPWVYTTGLTWDSANGAIVEATGAV